MPAQPVPLDQLPVGAITLLAWRLEDRDATGMRFRVFTRDRVARAVLLLAPDNTLTGQMLTPPSQTEVEPTTVPFRTGDVVVNDSTGEALVVRSVWSTVDAFGYAWSNAIGRRPAYTPDGWSKVGTATLS